ncbi:hypothetical protein M8C21_003026, partial [Ambrosia artemisiifolia]
TCKTYARQLKKQGFDFRNCDFGSNKPCSRKLNDLLRCPDVDNDYAWFLNISIKESDEQIKHVILEDQNDYESENENENNNEQVDENNKDPEYCLFLENLTEHGKSYKLKISQDDEEPRFLYYEEQDNSNWCDDLQTCIDDSGDETTVSEDMQIEQKAKRRRNETSGRISTKKEVSKRKKVDDQKTISEHPQDQGMTLDPWYTMFMNSAYSAVKCNAVKSIAVKIEPEEYENNVTVTASYSDSDVVILDNVRKVNCSEVNNKQLVLAEKEPSLKEKLMYILKHPYNEEEYKELSEYIEQEKPVCQLKPLRNGRTRAFAEAGRNISLLNYGPQIFQEKLKAAKKDRPRALNLLRMFRFWLEHIPSKDAFQPWKDDNFLKVQPSK